MTILAQLKQAISQYQGPLPACGNSVEEIWFRAAVKQMFALEQAAK